MYNVHDVPVCGTWANLIGQSELLQCGVVDNRVEESLHPHTHPCMCACVHVCTKTNKTLKQFHTMGMHVITIYYTSHRPTHIVIENNDVTVEPRK